MLEIYRDLHGAYDTNKQKPTSCAGVAGFHQIVLPHVNQLVDDRLLRSICSPAKRGIQTEVSTYTLILAHLSAPRLQQRTQLCGNRADKIRLPLLLNIEGDFHEKLDQHVEIVGRPQLGDFVENRRIFDSRSWEHVVEQVSKHIESRFLNATASYTWKRSKPLEHQKLISE